MRRILRSLPRLHAPLVSFVVATTALAGCAAGDPLEGLAERAPAEPAEVTIDGGARMDSGPKVMPEASAPLAPSAPVALAPDVELDEVAVFQGVKVSVASDGTAVTARNAPVVARRPMLVRVYVTPKATFRTHELTGELRLKDGAKDLPTLTSVLTPKATSTDGALESTFNFDVPAELVTETLRFAVSIKDPSAPRGALAKPSTAEYPKGGTDEALGAKGNGKSLKVVLVPVRYDADGSKRYPDTSAAQVEKYRQYLFSLYPTANVEVTVHSNVVWAESVTGSDSKAWARFLAGVTALRANDQVADDVYYYGLFEPAATKAENCREGCITGMCNLVVNAGDASMRACIGMGYPGIESAETMGHELGHAHGRPHSPCGAKDNEPTDPDPTFPASGLYERAGIGTWGYDLLAKTLVAPSKSKDFMSYCDPAWISDYNYQKLFTRIAAVNASATTSSFLASAPADPHPYRYLIDVDGELSWGPSVRLVKAPLGETRRVVFRDEAGNVIGERIAHRYRHSEGSGASLLVDDPPAVFSTMTLEPGADAEVTRSVRSDAR